MFSCILTGCLVATSVAEIMLLVAGTRSEAAVVPDKSYPVLKWRSLDGGCE